MIPTLVINIKETHNWYTQRSYQYGHNQIRVYNDWLLKKIKGFISPNYDYSLFRR